MDTIAVHLYNIDRDRQKNPDCCCIVIGMHAETRIALKSRIKYKLNLTIVIVKNAQRGHFALNQVEIFGEAFLRGKASPRSSQYFLQGFLKGRFTFYPFRQGYKKMPLASRIAEKDFCRHNL